MEKIEVANRIKELREAKKMTQNALANAAGVSPTYIYQLERGEKSPTVEYLDHICWGLGLTQMWSRYSTVGLFSPRS